VFFESGVKEFAVPERVLAEARAYIPTASYRRSIPEATRLIAHRDPGDVPPLALALHLDTPLWTNDRDFARTGVTLFTTAQLLALFFPKHS